ncbi:DUF6895 family protein [Sphaerisporangium melleum]|nr:hypothetical protein [Sphaerisporangium melleum]
MDEVLTRAMAWVDGNLDAFLPAVAFWPPGTPPRHLSLLLDLAITCHFLCRRRTPVQPAAEKALDGVAEVFHQESFHDQLLHTPARFPYYLWLLAVLWRTDRLRDSHTRATAQRLLDGGYGDLAAATRPPYGLMETRYVLDLGGFEHRLPPLRELYGRTTAGTPISSGQVTEAVAYEVTHAVFFLTDFATRPLPALTPRARGLREAVDRLLGAHIRSGHWDLVSELIACRRALGRPDGLLDRLGRSCLSRAQLGGGALPGPRYDPAERDALPVEKRATYTFVRCYHTTLAAILCAAVDRPLR